MCTLNAAFIWTVRFPISAQNPLLVSTLIRNNDQSWCISRFIWFIKVNSTFSLFPVSTAKMQLWVKLSRFDHIWNYFYPANIRTMYKSTLFFLKNEILWNINLFTSNENSQSLEEASDWGVLEKGIESVKVRFPDGVNILSCCFDADSFQLLFLPSNLFSPALYHGNKWRSFSKAALHQKVAKFY